MKATSMRAILLCVAVHLAGCGVGGFSGNDNNKGGTYQNNPLMKKITGFASKGPIQNGTVHIRALNTNGSVGALLKTTKTSMFGKYTSSVTLTGPGLIEVSGSYTDEATGDTLNIPQDRPLRAAIDTVSSDMWIAVTPLTELAVRRAEPLLFGGQISASNELVSSIFKADIIATQPVEPSASMFALATTTQKDYTLVLAAISRMAHDYYGGSLTDALGAMANDLSKGDTLSTETGVKLQTALASFLQSENNNTGLRDVNLTNLVNVGGSTKAVRIKTTGTLPPGKTIHGITVTLALPPGVTVKVKDFREPELETDVAAIVASRAFSSEIFTTGHYEPASGSNPAKVTISLPSAGAGLGEFVTVYCDFPVGKTFNAADFSLTYLKVTDEDGQRFENVTAEIILD